MVVIKSSGEEARFKKGKEEKVVLRREKGN